MNAVELSKQTYSRVGEMIATSLVHGGPAPQFFSEAVTDYILFAMAKLRVMVEDVPDADVRAKLVKFQNVSEEGMRDLLDSDEFAFRFDIGVGQATHLLKLADKERMFHLIASHFAVIRVKAEL